MDRPERRRVGWRLRVAVAWLLVSALWFIAGEGLVRISLPLLAVISAQLSPDYFPRLSLTGTGHERVVQLVATLTRYLPIDDTHGLHPGTRITVGIHLYHALVPVVIYHTALLIGLRREASHWLAVMAIALPMTAVVLGLSTPVLLVSHVEQVLTGEAARTTPGSGLLSSSALFSEVGGRWLLPLLAAGVTLKAAGRCLRWQQQISRGRFKPSEHTSGHPGIKP